MPVVAHALRLLLMSDSSTPPDPASESLFYLPQQHGDVDAKLAAGLERLGRVFRGLLWEAAGEHDLSPIQIRFLIDLRFRAETGRRVGELAETFDLTAPTVSDALQTLAEKGLVTKEPDPSDRRARIVRLTDAGRERADALSTWAEPVREHLRDLADDRKTDALTLVMDLVASLEASGKISRSRMCKTCRFFARDAHAGADAPHHCRLLDQPLAPGDLRIDCPEHEPEGASD
jgi:DNA-binding MarR family transcriptional regulator